MCNLMASLKQQWKNKMETNQEIKRASLDLEHHRKKMAVVQQDLNSSEAWERELEERRTAVEHRCKPPLLRFSEGLEQLCLGTMVGESLLEELATGEDWGNVLQVSSSRIMTTNTLGRYETIMLVKIMFRIKDLYVEKDVEDAVAGFQELIRKLLVQLGNPGQNWEGLDAREAEVMMFVVRQLDEIPPFVIQLLESLLSTNESEDRLVLREISTQTCCEINNDSQHDAGNQTCRKFPDHGGRKTL